ncbi:hypothetical protein [Actinoplanes sp. CA-252034]|uniref:hypothetical protein n=1 Tax=Actinoplanes sp. CA-252034 TaxID=3239906 RepID=UPI003D977384
MHSRFAKSRLLAVSTAAAVAAGLAVPGQALSAPAPTPAPTAPSADGGAMPQPDATLGSSWRKSSDVIVTGAGDTDGYHLYIAREKDAFAWKTLATLKSSSLEIGPWMGEVCVTGSGRYAVAVFAPKKAANKPELMRAGGFAAVVDTTTGKSTHVATGVSLSYYNPACGPDDRVLVNRSIGDDFGTDTEILTIDAAAAKVTGTRKVKGQLTTPAPAPDGDYGIAGGKLVKIAADGRTTKVATINGQAFGVRATARSGLDIVSVRGRETVAERFSGGKLRETARGPVGKLQLFGQAGGENALVGTTTSAVTTAQLKTVATDARVDKVSARGHLLAEEVFSKQSAVAVQSPLQFADPEDAGKVTVKLRAATSGARVTHELKATKAPVLDADINSSPDKGGAAKVSAALAARSITQPKCIVRRNDPMMQPHQPSPNQVEWAIDQAVHGRLMVQRPADYLKAGLPAYRPQALFERKELIGGGHVPANVLLGVVAQETNMSQASWHVVPGDTGNPLIGSYYGNKGNLDYINYDDADCGYGIGQVTDGMAGGLWTDTQARAISLDYAANIAASLNILIEKWNQLQLEPSQYQTLMNNNDPSYVENWFTALWAYNSGYYPYDRRNSTLQGGYWGIGWLNNPANTEYPADRDPFLRKTMADAERPSKWSYPERIMGWVENPQKKGLVIWTEAYSKPTFGNSGRSDDENLKRILSVPGRFDFCNPAVNGCSEAANGCPAVNASCWFYGHSQSRWPAGPGQQKHKGDIANCLLEECTTEKLAYSLGSSEPETDRIYPKECDTFGFWSDPARDATKKVSIVYSLNDTSRHNLGCGDVEEQNGKFTLRLGNPAGSPDTAPYAEIDLHQAGAGYKGHSWFTYMYPNERYKHKIVGTWIPDLDLAPGTRSRYSVVAHLPNHGADGFGDYQIYNGPITDVTKECHVDFEAETQSDIPGVVGKGKWVYLGNYDMGRGSQVQISNIGVPEFEGNDSVAFDAMAFVPTATRNPAAAACREDYPQ